MSVTADSVTSDADTDRTGRAGGPDTSEGVSGFSEMTQRVLAGQLPYEPDSLTGQNGAISEVRVFDLKQSMQNGGGPACLRLRVALNETELAAVNPGVIMTAPLYDTLTQWVDRHYRDRLGEADLADPQLLIECRTALDELTEIMKLGSVYPFQRQP